MKKVVLTGGTGFIGYWLIKELVKNNIFVYAIVRKNSPNKEKLRGIENVKIIEMGLREINLLPLYVDQADVFYHLAWEGDRNNIDSQIVNIANSVLAMRVASKLGIEKFIATGSQAEYGPARDLIDEEHPTNPTTAYGVCKLATYKALEVLSRYLDINLAWIRVFSVYGPGDNPNTLISYLIRCFNEERVPELSKGNQIWNYLYVEDAVKALYLLGINNATGVFNLAGGQNGPLKDFILEARDMIKPNLKLNFNSLIEKNKINLNVDIRKINKTLDWQPKYSFKEGIKKTYFSKGRL